MMNLFKSINSFVYRIAGNAKLLYWIFITILMISNTILLFTEPMGLCAKLAFILLPLGIQMLLMSIIRKPGLTFLILLPKSILDAFQLVLIKLYGGSFIAVDMFLNVVTTNPSEVGELLSNIAPVIILLLVIYIPALILSVCSLKQHTKLPEAFKRVITRVSLALTAAGIILFCIAKWSKGGFIAKYDLYPLNVIYNMDFALKKWGKMDNCDKDIREFKFEAYRDLPDKNQDSCKTREIYVMVIGETARAKSWGLYGYERETTPFADTCSNLIKFNALTQSNTTHKSVPLLLTPADAGSYNLLYKCKSIVTLFKECGFKSVYLTNHSYRQTFMERYFNEADISISLRENSQSGYDHQMIDSLKNILDSDTTGNIFVVMHIYGSHFNYHERYPKQFASFLPDYAETISPIYKQELVNSYDNSILYTDNFLKKSIDLIKEEKCKSFLIYTSDHGEDLMDDGRQRFLHASPIPTAYQLQVPFIFWYSNNYRKSEFRKIQLTLQNASYSISSNEVLFHTVANLASIKSPYVNESLSLCSSEFKAKELMYLTDHDGSIDISNLPLKRHDRQMLEEEGFLTNN